MNDYKSIDKRQWTCLNKEGDAGSGLIYTNPEEPDSIDSLAARMAEFGHQLHATEALGSEWIPSMKEWMLQAVTSTLMIEGKGKEDLAAFLLG